MTDKQLARALRQKYFDTLYGQKVQISEKIDMWLPVAKLARELIEEDK